MGIECIRLLRNIGRFDSVNAGAQLPLARLALVYAENGQGKTTLATILRSAGNGEAALLAERHRLGAQQQAHLVIAPRVGAPLVFQNGAWSSTLPTIAVFDDYFVAQNVCSGIEIETAHRQNLHELILGAQGVALNTALQGYVGRIEQHNSSLRTLAGAIPAAVRGALSVDDFCSLPVHANIDEAIREAERHLAAAQSADAVRQAAHFYALTLPAFDVGEINALLARTLPDLEAAAAANVQAHLAKLGPDAATWVGDGMHRIGGASQGKDNEICPFCAQDLVSSPLLRHYQAYFSLAYEGLKRDVAQYIQEVKTAHGDSAALVFERSVRDAERCKAFWSQFLEVPEITIDTAAVTQAWTQATEVVAQALAGKQSSPLEGARLTEAALAAIGAYEAAKAAVVACSDSLQSCNGQITLVKAGAATANVAALDLELARLRRIQSRHSDPVASQCAAYLTEKASKTQTEQLRDQARQALDTYRDNVFPAYQQAINAYLVRFNAGFRLGAIQSTNNRAGSSCTYNVLINNAAVPLTSNAGPSFRNTLSAGDRNALALSFFFASLDQDPQLAQKIVVIDDPMTSLDEHRSLTTVQEIRRLANRVTQVIVLSHSKSFLCALWEGANSADRSAIRVLRTAVGSTLAPWDVRQDCITEHDKRHELVTRYLQAADPAEERAVATALRYILEAFARVAYPATFQPGSLLGPFIGICEQRVNTPAQILDQADITELRELLDYANLFHHDSNPAWATQAINDLALMQFARRTLCFARRA